MTVALEAGEWSAACPDHTLPQERDGNPFTGGWVGPRTGLDGQKTLPHWDSIPDHADHNQSLYELSYPTHTHTHIYGHSSKFEPDLGTEPRDIKAQL